MTWYITATPTSCGRPRPWEITSLLEYTQTVRLKIMYTYMCPLHMYMCNRNPLSAFVMHSLAYTMHSAISPYHSTCRACISSSVLSLPVRHQLHPLHLERVVVTVAGRLSCAPPSCGAQSALGHSDIVITQNALTVRAGTDNSNLSFNLRRNASAASVSITLLVFLFAR